MNTAQKTVAVGAMSGVILMLVLVYVLYQYIPAPSDIETLADRIAFALRMNVLAVAPLFLMIVFVGNGRFLSDAIDPTRHLETKSIEVNGRVADNTLQQNFLFLIGSVSLSTLLENDHISLIAVLAIVFAIMRIAFWIGYRINPLYRAPGMAGTMYLNLGILGTVLYQCLV
jgi:hypothetical protein